MPKPRLFFLFLKTALAGGTLGLAILAMMWAFKVTESEPVAVEEKPLPAPGSSVVRLPDDKPLPKFDPAPIPQPLAETSAPAATPLTEPNAAPEPLPEAVYSVPAASVYTTQRIPAVKPEAPRPPHDRYSVKVEKVQVRPNYQNPANVFVEIKLRFTSVEVDPALLGIRRIATVTAASLDGFAPVYLQSGRESRVRTDYEYEARGLGASVFFDVPLSTKKFDFLDGIVHVRREKTAQTFTWAPAAKNLNITHKHGDFSFTLRDFAMLGETLSTRCDITAPVRAVDAPDSEPIRFVRETIHFSDGTSESHTGSLHAPGPSTQRWEYLRARIPVDYAIRFPSEMEEEEFPFRVEDVFTPLLEKGRFFASFPKMEPYKSPTGATYQVTQLFSEDNTNGHALNIHMLAKYPPELSVVAAGSSPIEVEGFDDTGKRLFMLSRPDTSVSQLQTPNECSGSFQVSLPAANAQRIAILKGTQRVALSEKTTTHRVAIPSIDTHLKPMKKDGPLQFNSIIRRENVVLLEFTNEQGQENLNRWKAFIFNTVLLDRKGARLKPYRQSAESKGPNNPMLMKCEFKLDGFDPAFAETTVIAEGRLLTFEFSMVDIPLRMPKPTPKAVKTEETEE